MYDWESFRNPPILRTCRDSTHGSPRNAMMRYREYLRPQIWPIAKVAWSKAKARVRSNKAVTVNVTRIGKSPYRDRTQLQWVTVKTLREFMADACRFASLGTSISIAEFLCFGSSQASHRFIYRRAVDVFQTSRTRNMRSFSLLCFLVRSKKTWTLSISLSLCFLYRVLWK